MKKGWLATKKKKGFSLAEAIIATGIFVIVVTSVVGSYLSISKYILSAGAETQAIFLAEEGLEAVRNIRDNDFAKLVSGGPYGLSSSGNIWNFSGNQDTNGIYNRKITITSPDADTREVTSLIEWVHKGENKSLAIKREFTNWRKIKDINPVSRWPFDDNGGCIAEDVIGSNDGALMPDTCPNKSPIWISGKVGVSALNFNTTSTYNYVRVSDDNDLDLSTSGTIMAWVYPTSSATMAIVHKGAATSGSDEAYYFRMDSSRRLTGGGRNSSNTQFSVQTNTAITINTWNHVTFTWDSTGMKIYINGVLRTNANTTVFNARNSSGSLQIGIYYPTLQTNRFRGRIDEVSIYNIALSAADILNIYNSQK